MPTAATRQRPDCTRGIVLNPQGAAAPAAAPPGKRAIDLEVLFEFDSSRLTADGRDVLDAFTVTFDAAQNRATLAPR